MLVERWRETSESEAELAVLRCSSFPYALRRALAQGARVGRQVVLAASAHASLRRRLGRHQRPPPQPRGPPHPPRQAQPRPGLGLVCERLRPGLPGARAQLVLRLARLVGVAQPQRQRPPRSSARKQRCRGLTAPARGAALSHMEAADASGPLHRDNFSLGTGAELLMELERKYWESSAAAAPPAAAAAFFPVPFTHSLQRLNCVLLLSRPPRRARRRSSGPKWASTPGRPCRPSPTWPPPPPSKRRSWCRLSAPWSAPSRRPSCACATSPMHRTTASCRPRPPTLCRRSPAPWPPAAASPSPGHASPPPPPKAARRSMPWRAPPTRRRLRRPRTGCWPCWCRWRGSSTAAGPT